jgi:hypothetical protein
MEVIGDVTVPSIPRNAIHHLKYCTRSDQLQAKDERTTMTLVSRSNCGDTCL